MRFIKFLATLLLGITIGETLNEFRTKKTSPDMSFWTFLKEEIRFNKNLATSSVKEGWELASTGDQEGMKRLSRNLFFPNIKD